MPKILAPHEHRLTDAQRKEKETKKKKTQGLVRMFFWLDHKSTTVIATHKNNCGVSNNSEALNSILHQHSVY